ncbi:thioredoxin family protein [Chloroflexota bacterium]
MNNTPSVVTTERYSSGLTYQDYITRIKVNKEQFENFYESGQLNTEDEAFFRKAAQTPNGIGKMLVIGEAWCPDVFRGMPVAARISEATGVELRIFPRDENLDIMNEFLNQGKFISIPVIVFYTEVLCPICHWIERPALANLEREQIEASINKELPDADEQEQRAEIQIRTQSRYPDWQQESIREMRLMLAEKLNI